MYVKILVKDPSQTTRSGKISSKCSVTILCDTNCGTNVLSTIKRVAIVLRESRIFSTQLSNEDSRENPNEPIIFQSCVRPLVLTDSLIPRFTVRDKNALAIDTRMLYGENALTRV